MRLDISVSISNDVPYRDGYSPYRLRNREMRDDIGAALDAAVDVVNDHDASSIVMPVTHDGDQVGSLSITVK